MKGSFARDYFLMSLSDCGLSILVATSLRILIVRKRILGTESLRCLIRIGTIFSAAVSGAMFNASTCYAHSVRIVRQALLTLSD